MAKLNTRTARTAAYTQRVVRHPAATRNEAGGLAFDTAAKTRLYKAAVTSLVGEDKFYTSGRAHDKMIRQDIRTVAQEDPEWILQLASYARNEMYLRSVAVVLLVEASQIPQCRPFVRKWTPHILKRADEPKEALAYALNTFGRPVHVGLRRGIADAMLGFDEYQLTKYDSRRKGGDVALSDVLALCRPRPTNASQEALFGYLMGKEVDADLIPKVTAKREFDALEKWGPEAKRLIKEGHVTWEVAVTKFGNDKAVWDALDLPYMAALRNLRNLVAAGADVAPVLAMLCDPERVRRSQQMPFRFWSAIKALGGDGLTVRDVYYGRCADPFQVVGGDAGRVRKALATALEHSTANIPALPGKTLVMVDVSGSMDQEVSQRSDMTCAEIAALFGAAIARRMPESLVVAFAETYKFLDVSGMPIPDGMQHILRATQHSATYAHLPIKHLRRSHSYVDRIILLSDMQCYSGRDYFHDGTLPEEMVKYRAEVNPHVKLISIDLTGYRTAPFLEGDPNTALLGGWSDRLFDFVKVFEQGDLDADKLIACYKPPALRKPYWATLAPPRGRWVQKQERIVEQSKGPYSLSAIAQACGVTHDTVQRWVRAGKLTVTKRNGETTVSRTALSRFSKTSPRYATQIGHLI